MKSTKWKLVKVMLIITIEVNAPSGMALAVKEDLAMLCERYGDTRVVSVQAKKEGESQ